MVKEKPKTLRLPAQAQRHSCNSNPPPIAGLVDLHWSFAWLAATNHELAVRHQLHIVRAADAERMRPRVLREATVTLAVPRRSLSLGGENTWNRMRGS
jgi:hypothetical protein